MRVLVFLLTGCPSEGCSWAHLHPSDIGVISRWYRVVAKATADVGVSLKLDTRWGVAPGI